MAEKVIDSFKDKYRFLSNFYQCDFVYEGLTYHNAEAAFQAQKCSTEEDKIKYTEVKNPVVAKRMGKKEPNLPPNWNCVRDHIMYKILLAKFANPELQAKLLATGYTQLVEGNKHHDNYWGKCTCEKCKDKEGCNRLGINLMVVRNYYRDGISWRAAYEDPWKDVVDAFRDFRNVDTDKLKHLIAYTYYECEEMMADALEFPGDYLLIYKYICQASFFLRMNGLLDKQPEVSAAFEDFIGGLCSEIEDGFFCGDTTLEHPLHLGTTKLTPDGYDYRYADMSSDESFLKAFDNDVEYFKSFSQGKIAFISDLESESDNTKAWGDIVEAFSKNEEIDIDTLKRLIFDTHKEFERLFHSDKHYFWSYLRIYKFICQAGFYLSMNYLSKVAPAVSSAVEDFINGLSFEIENWVYREKDPDHCLHLGTAMYTPAGCCERHADMSSYESFLSDFDEDAAFLKGLGHEDNEE